jgi:hypothetical protein
MIIQQKKGPDRVAFDTLEEGSAFRAVDINRNILWMKIQSVETRCAFYNAVDLFDGGVETFDDSELVIPVKATVVEE